MKKSPSDKRKHIAVSPPLKSEFDMLAKLKKMTHEVLLRHLVDLELK